MQVDPIDDTLWVANAPSDEFGTTGSRDSSLPRFSSTEPERAGLNLLGHRVEPLPSFVRGPR